MEGGIIDCVARDVFLLLGEKRKSNDGVEAKFQVSYLELYKEELRDLLELPAVQKEIHIREDDKGNTGDRIVFTVIYTAAYEGRAHGSRGETSQV